MRKYDVFGVGNAIVDILAFVSDDFISERGLAKGAMTLMDASEQASILIGIEREDVHLASGGSAANTMVAIAQSGGKGIYCGKVTSDTNGEFYRKDMHTSGIEFPVLPAPEASLPTGTCVVLTTPDAERTMCTHLGISTCLEPSEIDFEQLADCKISYIEGYLWDAELPRQACLETMQQSKRHGTKVAFTFSDSFLVHRYASDFKDVVSEYCDILFCNLDEAKIYCEADTIESCATILGKMVPLVFVTNSEHGCIVVENGEQKRVNGFPVKPLDTVGAGDAFAGGVLYGLTNGKSPAQAARWGNFLASKVVQINGPRLSQAPQQHELVW
ncbi:MAG TPA: adenosine kinase [Pirellulaceae bacterium]|nr:adenosine kinase [Pirellulaceae bacterium]HMO92829.1 adenosine kinase [Pirellulaceae bacterium]HMP69429.1 adenosine kinase [Pirellulaceae bacterium]